jgi:hypothetical protein
MPTNVVGELDIATSFRDGLVEQDGDLTVLVNQFRYDLGGIKGVYVGAVGQVVANNTVNYVYLNSIAALVINASGFPGSGDHIRLARVVTSSGFIISLLDERAFLASVATAQSTVPMVAGESIALGELLVGNAAGEVLRAASSFAGGLWRVLGAAAAAASASDPIQVTTSGSLGPVKFAVAPAGASNGSFVYLSTATGLGTLTPPVGGNVVFLVGVLMGADGATPTPDVLLQPQYISRIP